MKENRVKIKDLQLVVNKYKTYLNYFELLKINCS